MSKSNSRLVLLLLLAVAGPASAATETITLTTGEKISGTLISSSDDRIVLEHPILGRLEIPRDDVRHAPPPAHGLFGTSLLEGWKKHVDIGLTGSEGNSEEMSFRGGFGLDWKDEQERWRVLGSYTHSATDGTTDNHNAFVESRHDWLMTRSDWFAFSGGRWDYDEFEPWEHRLSAEAGPGYHLIEGDPFQLDVLTGPAVTNEFGSRDELRPEWMLGAEATWKLSETHTLQASNRFYRGLDRAEWRNLTRANWRIKFGSESALALNLGFDNEIDSDAEDEKNKLRYWSSLSYDF